MPEKWNGNYKDAYDPKKHERERIFVSEIYSSKQYLRENRTLAVDTLLKETKGVGIIKQIYLQSNSGAYSIQFIIDNDTIWDVSYAWLLANQATIHGITASSAAGVEYLSIEDFYFQKDFLIRIRPTTTIIYDIILIRYDIRNETILQEY